jgi:uncharacterized protein (DUF952 family)
MRTLFHIAKSKEWEDAKKDGVYNISTLNKSLDQVGYIHLSFAEQVKLVANFIYKDEDNLVLLKINPDKLKAHVVVEGVEGTDLKFPHLYGTLNIDAVEDVLIFQQMHDGSFPELNNL